MTTTETWVLWGVKENHGAGLKLEIGSLRECRTAMRRYNKENWTGLSILRKGDSYVTV